MTKKKSSVREPIDGVVLLDKSQGVTSNQALVAVKQILNARKAGHTGTLDPLATGLLPLCFGAATKFTHDLLQADKTYETTVLLGKTTTTGDLEGDVLETKPVHLTSEEVVKTISQFIGTIEQTPPMYSALKRNGIPLYEYARKGLVLEREKRAVVIHDIVIKSMVLPYVTFEVSCSKGTYIRTLGEDIGIALGCGAHLQTLRRTKVGSLTLKDAVSLDDVIKQKKGVLKSVDYLLATLPKFVLTESLSIRFGYGQRLSLEKEQVAFKDMGRVRVYDTIQRLLGTAIITSDGILVPERLIALDSTPKDV